MVHSVWNKAMAARIAAFLVGVLGLASLRATYDTAPLADLGTQLWALAGSYAVLTVLGVTAALLAVARGWQIGAAPAGGWWQCRWWCWAWIRTGRGWGCTG